MSFDKSFDKNPEDNGRRNLLKGAISGGVLAASAATLPGLVFPALAQGEKLVPFTDVPDTFRVGPVKPNAVHYLDTREIDTYFTDNDDFYLVQHYGQPEVDNDSYRLRVTGMVDKELEFSLADLMSKDVIEQQVGFECGGNAQRLFQGLIGNAYWRGRTLNTILEEAGIQDGRRKSFSLAPILPKRKFEAKKWIKLLRVAFRLKMQCDQRICSRSK
jgi:DMSO/TMAO reductase YedYZ molybdopterin-dependent catalytic subunit